MASPTPPPDDTEGLLASLDDLGARIEAARHSPGAAGGGAGSGRLRWVLGLAVLAVLLLIGGLALSGGDDGDDSDVAAGDRATQVTDTTQGSSATTATTAAPTTVAPTTAPPTTTAPTTVTTVAPTPTPPPETEPPPSNTPPSEPDGSEATWTVVPGESFWTIAEHVTADRLGREGTVAEVTPIWVDIVAANADRLVEPGNPNLILPGQVLVLPATAASP